MAEYKGESKCIPKGFERVKKNIYNAKKKVANDRFDS